MQWESRRPRGGRPSLRHRRPDNERRPAGAAGRVVDLPAATLEARAGGFGSGGADHNAAAGLGDREPPLALHAAQRAGRGEGLPQRSKSRTLRGDAGYDEGLGERERRDPVRRGLLLGSRCGRPSPCVQALNGSSAWMRGHPTATAVAARALKRCRRAGNSCSATPNDRLETDKAITPATKSLQIVIFGTGGWTHRR
jgi:hypothetical protein